MLHVALWLLSWKDSVESVAFLKLVTICVDSTTAPHPRRQLGCCLGCIVVLSFFYVGILPDRCFYISAPQHFSTWHIARSVFFKVLRNTFSHGTLPDRYFYKCSATLSNLLLQILSWTSPANHRIHSSSPSLLPFHRSFLLCSCPLPQLSPLQRSLLSVPLRLQTLPAALHRS